MEGLEKVVTEVNRLNVVCERDVGERREESRLANRGHAFVSKDKLLSRVQRGTKDAIHLLSAPQCLKGPTQLQTLDGSGLHGKCPGSQSLFLDHIWWHGSTWLMEFSMLWLFKLDAGRLGQLIARRNRLEGWNITGTESHRLGVAILKPYINEEESSVCNKRRINEMCIEKVRETCVYTEQVLLHF